MRGTRPAWPSRRLRRATEAIAGRRVAEVTGGPTVNLVREDRGGRPARWARADLKEMKDYKDGLVSQAPGVIPVWPDRAAPGHA